MDQNQQLGLAFMLMYQHLSKLSLSKEVIRFFEGSGAYKPLEHYKMLRGLIRGTNVLTVGKSPQEIKSLVRNQNCQHTIGPHSIIKMMDYMLKKAYFRPCEVLIAALPEIMDVFIGRYFFGEDLVEVNPGSHVVVHSCKNITPEKLPPLYWEKNTIHLALKVYSELSWTEAPMTIGTRHGTQVPKRLKLKTIETQHVMSYGEHYQALIALDSGILPSKSPDYSMLQNAAKHFLETYPFITTETVEYAIKHLFTIPGDWLGCVVIAAGTTYTINGILLSPAYKFSNAAEEIIAGKAWEVFLIPTAFVPFFAVNQPEIYQLPYFRKPTD